MRADLDIDTTDLGPCSSICQHAVVAELQQSGETHEQWLLRLGQIARQRKPRKTETEPRRRVDTERCERLIPPRSRKTVRFTCAHCQQVVERSVINPTQPPKYCSTDCRLMARGWLPGSKAEHRRRNRGFVAEVNARTVCAHCGTQPIEWHNPEHVELNRQRHRISDLVQSPRSIAVIEAEIARCTPLCRRCHMAEDGRLRNFMQMATAPKPITEPTPCIECSRPYKPLRRGLCSRCNDHRRRRKGLTPTPAVDWRGQPLKAGDTHAS